MFSLAVQQYSRFHFKSEIRMNKVQVYFKYMQFI